jgi:Uma2 family endonuclease
MAIQVGELLTAEEFAALPDMPGIQLELVRGRVIEVAGTGAWHGFIVGLVFEAINAFARKHRLGAAFADNVSYIVGRGPDVVRIPDASLVSRDRIAKHGIPEAFWPFAPDLAVEVVSPGDDAQDVYGKVHEYLDGGTRLVWVLWPAYRAATVYEQGGVVRELGADDVLDGGEVLPGFSHRLGDFFEKPDWL